jgi:hypothetical protein
MNRAFSAREDDLVRLEVIAPAAQLAVDLVFGNVHVARRVGVQAEDAAAVARGHQAHPVFAHVGDLLAREHSALQVLLPLHQMVPLRRCDLAVLRQPTGVPAQPETAQGSTPS